MNRLDQKKSSIIVIRLGSVDIRQESQWPAAID